MIIIKSYKSITPGQRHRVIVHNNNFNKIKPYKPLVTRLKNNSGRNHHGHITVRHRGGGYKTKYRLLNSNYNNIYNNNQNKNDTINRKQELLKYNVIKLEYDPNRSAHIALIKLNIEHGITTYNNTANIKSLYSYIIAPAHIKIGDNIVAGANADINIGNRLLLKHIPIGQSVFNIQSVPNSNSFVARAAGTTAYIIKKEFNGNVTIKLPSGEIKNFNENCFASIGVVSNAEHCHIKKGKAGVTRWLGIRPTVRGTAMNPIDHPHGGGQGKTSGGRPSVTPWGKITKGKPTRLNKRTNYRILSSI